MYTTEISIPILDFIVLACSLSRFPNNIPDLTSNRKTAITPSSEGVDNPSNSPDQASRSSLRLYLTSHVICSQAPGQKIGELAPFTYWSQNSPLFLPLIHHKHFEITI